MLEKAQQDPRDERIANKSRPVRNLVVRGNANMPFSSAPQDPGKAKQTQIPVDTRMRQCSSEISTGKLVGRETLQAIHSGILQQIGLIKSGKVMK